MNIIIIDVSLNVIDDDLIGKHNDVNKKLTK